jgi:hypothetical protein
LLSGREESIYIVRLASDYEHATYLCRPALQVLQYALLQTALGNHPTPEASLRATSYVSLVRRYMRNTLIRISTSAKLVSVLPIV